jgi:hypothetical protein
VSIVIGEITPHFPLGSVCTRSLFAGKGRRATTTAPFRFVDGDLVVDVPEGFVTDYNSVPRVLWWRFAPWEFPEAGITHDWLYQHPGSLTRGDIDKIHRRILEIEGADARLQFEAYWGIRAVAWKPWGEYRRAEIPHA